MQQYIVTQGQTLPPLGQLITCSNLDQVVTGIRVTVGGSAVEQQLVQIHRIRARPFSARLAVWERAGWEHTVRSAVGVTLASVDIPCVRVDNEREFSRQRGDWPKSLLHSVWVEMLGSAQRPGIGTIECAVTERNGQHGVTQCYDVQVLDMESTDAVSVRLQWQKPLQECWRNWQQALRCFARVLASLPAGPRAFWVEAVSQQWPDLPAGCMVLSDRGVTGDRRFRAIVRGLQQGTVERITWRLPHRVDHAREVLGGVLTAGHRYQPGPVQMLLTLGRAHVPQEREQEVYNRFCQEFSKIESFRWRSVKHPNDWLTWAESNIWQSVF